MIFYVDWSLYSSTRRWWSSVKIFPKGEQSSSNKNRDSCLRDPLNLCPTNVLRYTTLGLIVLSSLMSETFVGRTQLSGIYTVNWSTHDHSLTELERYRVNREKLSTPLLRTECIDVILSAPIYSFRESSQETCISKLSTTEIVKQW